MKSGQVKLLAALLICIMLLSGCADEFGDVTNIDIINLKNGEKDSFAPDTDTGKIVLDAMRNIEKTDVQGVKPQYEIAIAADSAKSSYGLSFDVADKLAYVIKDDEMYRVKAGNAARLFTEKSFSYVYVDSYMHDMELKKNGDSQDVSLRYDWSYRDTEGFEGKREGIKSDAEGRVKVEAADKLSMTYSSPPDSQIVKIYKDGNIEATGSDLTVACDNISTDGTYYVEVEAKWYKGKNHDSYGIQTAGFELSVDRPADFEVVTKENYPGNMMIIQISNMDENETVNLTTSIADDAVSVYPHGNKHMALLPIGLYVPAGTEEIKAVFNEGKADEYTVIKNVEIGAKSFKTQYLTVSEELNSTNNDDGSISQFVQVVKPARSVSEPKKLWDGVFEMPIEGRLTTDFAEIRYVNNEMSSSRHSGLDLAAPTGTLIKAPNNGKVVLTAENLLSSGNTVVIDHGMGLFTSYYHMNTISVKEGDTVEKGDTIGTVGTTGFSTGPHLHYAVSIFNSYVNPYQTLTGIFD